MANTVKELCTTDISKDEMGNFPESMYELSLLFDKRLKDILQAHENAIAEKDKLINKYINNEAILNSNIMGLMNSYNKKIVNIQLYKEDFVIGDNYKGSIETYEEDDSFYSDDVKYVLKDNLNYEKLPSKDVK